MVQKSLESCSLTFSSHHILASLPFSTTLSGLYVLLIEDKCDKLLTLKLHQSHTCDDKYCLLCNYTCVAEFKAKIRKHLKGKCTKYTSSISPVNIKMISHKLIILLGIFSTLDISYSGMCP